jgi:site-specific recombinase XerD
VVFLLSPSMILSYFSSQDWQSWDVERRPVIPEGMPVLIDDDLLFEDGPAAPRPASVVNQWLRLLPASGAPAPSSWENYARAVKEWTEFLVEHGIGLFDARDRLKAGLSRYAEHRAAGPMQARFAATTWAQHMSILSLFYRWAMEEEGFAAAEPFTYRSARAVFSGTGRDVRVNMAVRRTPKPHVTIKYLEPDFTDLFRKGLRGLAPDGNRDTGFAGREMTRNAAIGDLALATGLRLGEFTHLLAWEIPALPSSPTAIPIPFPVPGGITKGRKFRTTWISYEALAGLHDYLQLDRAAVTDGSSWRPPRRWGEPLQVTDPDARGGRINGIRRSWESLIPVERRRLVAPEGGSCLLAVKGDGGPFTAWATVADQGFTGGIADLRRGQLAQFWMAGPHWLEALTRSLVEGYARSGGRLGDGGCSSNGWRTRRCCAVSCRQTSEPRCG